MKVKEYEIEFRHNRKLFKGSVQEIAGAFKLPIIRVSVQFPTEKWRSTFIFWRETPAKLFWHQTPVLDEKLMKSMNAAIVKHPAFRK